jgi:NAD(P)-dependent dehydrogenase (short-subunit alcohol dehydrogenase family)
MLQKNITLSKAVLFVSAVFLVLGIFLSHMIGGRTALYTSPPYRFSDIPDLTGKVAVVTGSNTGIGYVTARELARRGAHVIATARDEGRGQDAVSLMKREISTSQEESHRSSGARASEPQVEFMRLDLSSLRQVKEFAREFLRRGLRVDMLILNAGVVMPEFGYTSEGFELQVRFDSFGLSFRW